MRMVSRATTAPADAALERTIADVERTAWLTENQEAIDVYNARVVKRGVFSDGRRRF